MTAPAMTMLAIMTGSESVILFFSLTHFVFPAFSTAFYYSKNTTQVLDQFLATSISETSELTESYLVGNRLVKFLSVVLPTHVDYFTKDPRLVDSRSRI